MFLSAIALLWWCSNNWNISTHDNESNSNTWVVNTSTANATTNATTTNSDKNITWDKVSKGSYKFIWFVGTFCPHCQAEVPKLDKFYTQYSNQVNMELNVLDRKKFPNTHIPQNYTNPRQYRDYTNEECWYVPSYVIVDSKNNVVDKKCWWAPTEDELKKYLLKGNTKTSSSEWVWKDNQSNYKTGDKNLNNKKQTMTDQKKLVKAGDIIEVNYIWTFTDGTVFDTSLEDVAKKSNKYNSARDYKPLKFTVGAWQMIPCFDKGVVGMKIWETKKITCQPQDAYGECDENKVQTVKKEQLKQFEDHGYKLEKWAELPTQYGMIKIKDVKGDDVILDLNNPMCGKVLNFEITLVKIDE